MLNTYQVWNTESTQCDTHAELLALELDGYSHSSFITTNDIDGIINAILNETNADMGYHLIPQPIRVELYKSCDADYTQSVEDGAITVLDTADVFTIHSTAYDALLENARMVADSLGRADDLSYVTFDVCGNFLDCGRLDKVGA